MTLDDPGWLERWRATIVTLVDLNGLHGLIGGRVTWILLDIKRRAQNRT